jgi:hypothetical protein
MCGTAGPFINLRRATGYSGTAGVSSINSMALPPQAGEDAAPFGSLMFRQAMLASISFTFALSGCSAPRPAIEVTNPDPSGKIPAMKKAVREHDLTAVRQLVKDLDSDDPAVRMFAIHALHELSGQRYDYDYFADEVQRQPALKRWQEWLAHQEGKSPSARPGDDSRLVGGKPGD